MSGRKAYKHLPAEILTLFLSYKPYNGPDNILWAVNKICNTKKHCALIPLRIKNALASFSAEVPDNSAIGFERETFGRDTLFRGWIPEKREMILVTVPAGLNPNIRGDFTFTVAIEGVETMPRAAADLLDQMFRIVEGVLVATEAECRRLGFII
jgi:hypothetical protein